MDSHLIRLKNNPKHFIHISDKFIRNEENIVYLCIYIGISSVCKNSTANHLTFGQQLIGFKAFRQFSSRIVLRSCLNDSKPRECRFESTGGLHLIDLFRYFFKMQLNCDLKCKINIVKDFWSKLTHCNHTKR